MLIAAYVMLAIAAGIFGLYAWMVARGHGALPDGSSGHWTPISPTYRTAFFSLGLGFSGLSLLLIAFLLRLESRGVLQGYEGGAVLLSAMLLALALMSLSWLRESHRERVEHAVLAAPPPAAMVAEPPPLQATQPRQSDAEWWAGLAATAPRTTSRQEPPPLSMSAAEKAAADLDAARSFGNVPGLSLGGTRMPQGPMRPLGMVAPRDAEAERAAPDARPMATPMAGPMPPASARQVPPQPPADQAPRLNLIEAALSQGFLAQGRDTDSESRPTPLPPGRFATLRPAEPLPEMPELAEKPGMMRPQDDMPRRSLIESALGHFPALTPQHGEPSPPAWHAAEPAAPIAPPLEAPGSMPEHQFAGSLLAEDGAAGLLGTVSQPAPDFFASVMSPQASIPEPQPISEPQHVVEHMPPPTPVVTVPVMVTPIIPPPSMQAAPPPPPAPPPPAPPPPVPVTLSAPSPVVLAPQMAPLSGAIELLLPRYQVSGWVGDPLGEVPVEEIEIVALRDGAEIGRAKVGETRQEAGQGRGGFVLQVSTPVRFADLASGALQVLARARGRQCTLAPSETLRGTFELAAAVQTLQGAMGGVGVSDLAELLQSLVRTREIDERVATRCMELHAAFLARSGRG